MAGTRLEPSYTLADDPTHPHPTALAIRGTGRLTRALRTGNRIVVSGTIGVEADGSVTPDAGAQADRCFALIREHIEYLGGRMDDVVRVRMFVTDIADADTVTAAFTRALGHVRPTGTLVAIAALYRPEWKVEIEAEAVVGDDG